MKAIGLVSLENEEAQLWDKARDLTEQSRAAFSRQATIERAKQILREHAQEDTSYKEALEHEIN